LPEFFSWRDVKLIDLTHIFSFEDMSFFIGLSVYEIEKQIYIVISSKILTFFGAYFP